MKKVILIILLLSLFFTLAGSVQAIDTIVKSYPELPGAPEPTAGIPQYIRYIFVFSLGIVGIIAFIAMLVAAFGYVTSVGNPQKAAASKDKIFSALLGMLLLFASYLLLNTINPDLLKFKITGEKVDIEVEGPKEPEGCQFQWASWDKVELNAGENATLTLGATKKCKDVGFEKVEIWIEHKDRKCAVIKHECSSSDEVQSRTDCAIIKGEDAKENKHIEFLGTKEQGNTLEYSFEYNFGNSDIGEYCGTAGCPGFVKEDEGYLICNFNKEKKEIFITEGTIKMEGQSTQYIPKLTITIRDLTDEGACCW